MMFLNNKKVLWLTRQMNHLFNFRFEIDVVVVFLNNQTLCIRLIKMKVWMFDTHSPTIDSIAFVENKE